VWVPIEELAKVFRIVLVNFWKIICILAYHSISAA
jgi:hypothetical protein